MKAKRRWMRWVIEAASDPSLDMPYGRGRRRAMRRRRAAA